MKDQHEYRWAVATLKEALAYMNAEHKGKESLQMSTSEGNKTLCNTCVQANRTCPIYPQETQHCVEYQKKGDLCFDCKGEAMPATDAGEPDWLCCKKCDLMWNPRGFGLGELSDTKETP